jgi:hypothetical protein
MIKKSSHNTTNSKVDYVWFTTIDWSRTEQVNLLDVLCVDCEGEHATSCAIDCINSASTDLLLTVITVSATGEC